MSKREEALNALHALLKQALPDIDVFRNEMDDARIGDGYANLLDGDPGEPEVYLSPRAYSFDHVADFIVIVEGREPADRDAKLDGILMNVGQAIDANPTLGGAVEYCQPGAPDAESEQIAGGTDQKAALIPITLTYTTSSPLG